METKEKLNKLYDLKCGIEVHNLDKQALIDSILTPEIKAKIAEIEAEFADKTQFIQEEITKLEAEIKEDVTANGETVKGDYLMAVFAKGRVSWDTKALDGYAAAHPEVAQFRKEGAPSVSIRKAAA